MFDQLGVKNKKVAKIGIISQLSTYHVNVRQIKKQRGR